MKEHHITNEEFIAVGNEELQDFENGDIYETEPTEVRGEDLDEIESVNNFELFDHEWHEELEADLLKLPHIEESIGSFAPESICGRDDRKPVNSTQYPFKLICRLIITAKNGTRYAGSGFFISPRCIITSGHCVHLPIGSNVYDWAKSIKVIPGANGRSAPFGSQTSTRFRSVNGWTKKRKSDFDHGAIILPNNTLYNRVKGYLGYLQLNNSAILNNSGYPVDKPGTQWYNAGRVTRITQYKMEYMLDTKGGQSGSPVYIKQGSKRQVVGVHGYGGCPNKCIRVQGYVLTRWSEWSRL